ncbi:MAG: FeoA family protein [Campylobacterota bacterium]|nr:FeoA family protein [Campylobacterota bacterium]
MNTSLTYQKGDKLKIVKLHTTGDLRQRLISFGIIKGTQVEVLGYSTNKSTIEIKVAKMTIALRSGEAEKIEVEKI